MLDPILTPNSDWTLRDWRAAVDVTVESILDIDASNMISTDERKPWTRNINKWMDAGLPTRPDAIRMIAVFALVGQNKNSSILHPDHLRDHAHILLNSKKACNDRFADLSEEELAQIYEMLNKKKPAMLPVAEDVELFRRVHPQPPERLYGRVQGLAQVMRALQSASITVIDGVGGDGKTALAWHAAKDARNDGLITQFDWTTDKRFVVDVQGRPIATHVEPLDFNWILRSMIAHFGWHDLLGAKSNAQLENHCADRLSKGRYLLVVDNLETVKDSDLVVRGLQALLDRRGKLAPLSSRALITSRVQVSIGERVSLSGIEAAERIAYIRHLEHRLSGLESGLNDAQREVLAEKTGGNPLFLQIAVSRYSIAPSLDTFDEISASLDSAAKDFHRGFINLFGLLAEQLSESAYWLAGVAAVRQEIRYEHLWQIWCEAAQADPADARIHAQFTDLLYELVRYRVLDPLTDGTYGMHSLIRSYLRNTQ